jgi:hypothetical protein
MGLRWVAVVGAWAAMIAITFAIATSNLWEESSTGPRPARYDIQLAVACIGVVPVGFMIWAAFTNRRRLTLFWLVVSLVVYAVWGFLNDAAVHPSHH